MIKSEKPPFNISDMVCRTGDRLSYALFSLYTSTFSFLSNFSVKYFNVGYMPLDNIFPPNNE